MAKAKVIDVMGRKLLVEKKHIKNMYLRVSPKDKMIKVSCPSYFSDDRIRNFITEKLDWIDEKSKKLEEKTQERFNDGGKVLFFGEELDLKIMISNEKAVVKKENDTIIMCVPEFFGEKEKSELYDGFLKINFEKLLPYFVERCEKITGLRANTYKVRKMETRWGSCTTGKKDIRLSVRLATKDFECIECVLLHEMTHLLINGHGKDFYAKLEEFCPDLKRIERKLK